MSEGCSAWEERLVGLLYEDGDESERAETRAHLAQCAGCRAELDELTRTRGLLSAWPNAANVPRIVYVNERADLRARLRRRAAALRGWRPRALLGPVVAGVALILVAVTVTAVLDLQVAPDGTLRVGLLASGSAAVEHDGLSITREELSEELTGVVAYMEDVLEARRDEERRLLLAAIDERMQGQGHAMGQELRGAVSDAFADVQRQHESDLRLIFSAIDEMGVMTASQLQRMNAVLGSLTVSRTDY